MRSLPGWTPGEKWSVCGESASSRSDWRAWRNEPAQVVPGLFPPQISVEIKALACELPATLGLPLSRLSVADVARQAEHSGLVARISESTVWRWLHEDAIRPWQHRCWIFPRDPQFQAKAGRILDLYGRTWQGQALREDGPASRRVCAFTRAFPFLQASPCAWGTSTGARVRAYLAALDVHRAKVFGRCEATTGIAPFARLVDQVMSQPPYNEAQGVLVDG